MIKHTHFRLNTDTLNKYGIAVRPQGEMGVVQIKQIFRHQCAIYLKPQRYSVAVGPQRYVGVA